MRSPNLHTVYMRHLIEISIFLNPLKVQIFFFCALLTFILALFCLLFFCFHGVRYIGQYRPVASSIIGGGGGGGWEGLIFTGELTSFWTSFLMCILNHPTSRMEKVSFMNKQFLTKVEKSLISTQQLNTNDLHYRYLNKI